MKNGLIVTKDGTKMWYLNGKRHREDGPAIEYTDRTKRWFLKWKRLGEDGSGKKYKNDTKIW